MAQWRIGEIMEKWEFIDRAPNYAVSDEGGVKNLKTGRIVKQHVRRGHPTVKLTVDGRQIMVAVHTLVAEAFVPGEKTDWVVVHKDLDPFNLHASNLRWKPRYARSWYEGEEVDF